MTNTITRRLDRAASRLYEHAAGFFAASLFTELFTTWSTVVTMTLMWLCLISGVVCDVLANALDRNGEL